MSYQKKCPVDGPGVYPIVKRGDDLKHLSFQLIELGGSLSEVTIESGEEELAVDFYSGPVRPTLRRFRADCTTFSIAVTMSLP